MCGAVGVHFFGCSSLVGFGWSVGGDGVVGGGDGCVVWRV
jgi:hypothetical protein